jgi:hypothetical protein
MNKTTKCRSDNKIRNKFVRFKANAYFCNVKKTADRIYLDSVM